MYDDFVWYSCNVHIGIDEIVYKEERRKDEIKSLI